MSDSLSRKAMRGLYHTDPETPVEEEITVQFETFAIAFASVMVGSILFSLIMSLDVATLMVADLVGVESSIEEAWSVLLVPVFQVFFVGSLVVLVLSRSYQIYSLSDDEIERLEARSKTALTYYVAGFGVLCLLAMLVVGEQQSYETQQRVIDGFLQTVEIRDEFHRRFAAIWGTAVYSTAGVTGLLAGAFRTLDLRGAVLGGVVFTLCSIPLYPKTALLLL